jgi:hypothetical protein
MTSISHVEALDLSLFRWIRSETDDADRRSLLAVQRAVANSNGRFTYLEIGSHLGGSIQPYLVDPRCTKIYSIDPRPLEQPDDRREGCRWKYPDNSTQRMMDLLSAIDAASVDKIVCFEQSSTDVDPAKIDPKPQVAFIDGEHTHTAALADFSFCMKIIADGGVIVFHDFWIIYAAIFEICDRLRRMTPGAVPLMLDGSVFAVFLDRNLPSSDAFLNECYRRHKHYIRNLRIKMCARKYVPGPVRAFLGKTKSSLVTRMDPMKTRNSAN